MSLEQAEARRSQWAAKRAARLDPLDFPGTWSQRERDDYEQGTYYLDGKVEEFRRMAEAFAKAEPGLPPYQRWHADATGFRKILCEEYVEFSHPRTPKEHGQRENRRLSIQVLDRGERVLEDSGYTVATLRLGELMRAAGYAELPPIENQMVGRMPFPCSLPECERRIAELTALRDDAQRRLDIALAEPAPA